LWLEQLVFTEGQVLVEVDFCSSTEDVPTQTLTLPLKLASVTSLMCIMTL
jgi:hypothetical protein